MRCPFRTGVKPESFQARDNVANFINWVKTHLGVNEVLLFESDDLVLNKNEKNVIHEVIGLTFIAADD